MFFFQPVYMSNCSKTTTGKGCFQAEDARKDFGNTQVQSSGVHEIDRNGKREKRPFLKTKRTFRVPDSPTLNRVFINHCGSHITMSQQFLNGANVIISL